ncbi:MAG: (2Fe-2S)-binding protein [Thermoflexia bacterium]|nr:MAG: (2Fe-2S)-binding protein [Thermoflexia bacterium]
MSPATGGAVNTVFELNGRNVTAEHAPGDVLLTWLRRQGLVSVKFASEEGETGCDTVLIDGVPQNAGLILVGTLKGRQVTTLEGIQTPEMKRLQQTFIEEGALQCGYCTPGMLLAGYALLQQENRPTEAEIREALSAVTCRCTGYVKPVRAVLDFLATKDTKGHKDE